MDAMKNWNQPNTYNYSGMQMGKYTSVEQYEKILELDNFEEGDCFVASYPKTGTTLTQEIVYMIYNNGDTEKAKNGNLYERVPFIDSAEWSGIPSGLEMVQRLSHPKLIKTHLTYDCLPKAAMEKARFIYVMRNPKDMLVSYYYFYRTHEIFGCFPGNFHEFLELFYANKLDYGNYFDHLKLWIKAAKDNKDSILIVKYEDLLKDKFGQVKRIAEFCGKDLSEDVIRRIVKHTSFSEMKDNKTVNGEDYQPLDNEKASPFLRKGEIGDWKNHFSVAENERIEQYIKKEDIDIEFEYS